MLTAMTVTDATKVLTEREGTRISLPEGKGDKYKVRLMGWEPGATVVEGSSADYPVDVIKRDFPEAFPAGTRMKANHDGICTDPGGDIQRLMAKTVDTPWAESDGMYAHARISEHHSPLVREFGDVIGLSISAAAEMQTIDGEDGPEYALSERGKPIVERFLTMEESPYNSVDFVEAPGADGRIVARALESAKAHARELNVREQVTFAKDTLVPGEHKTSEASPPRDNKKESNMTDEEIQSAIVEAANSAAAKVAESLRPAEPTSEQPTLGAMAEAVATAGLTAAGRAGVYERVENGASVDQAIEAERTREAQMREELTAKPKAQEGFGFTVDEGDGEVAQSTVESRSAELEGMPV